MWILKPRVIRTGVANPTYGIYMNFRSFQVEARSSGLLTPHLALFSCEQKGGGGRHSSAAAAKETEFGGFKQERGIYWKDSK